MSSWVTYILQSNLDGTCCIGSTENLPLRLETHNKGKVRSTKSRIPWKVVYTEPAKSRREAYRRELQIKAHKSGRAFKKLLR